MAREADKNGNNNPDSENEYGSEIMQEAIQSLEKELELHTRNLKNNIDGKERFTKQWERDQKIWTIMIDNHMKLPEHIAFEYETVPEYWELRKEQLIEKYEEDKFKTESRLKKFDIDTEAINEQIKSATDKLNELKGDEE
jgi:hypothetical protein